MLVLVFAALGGGYLVFTSFAATPTEDLRTYFPGTTARGNTYKTNYVAGLNYTTTPPSDAVLWFEQIGPARKQTFKMYNSSPADISRRCHWDLFTWGPTSLQYNETNHQCNGDNTDIAYVPGITYMPRKWQSTAPWSLSGSSRATFSSGGVVKCKGTNVWTAEVVGWVTIAPNVPTIQVRSNQTTTWDKDSGSDPTGCGPGVVSHYQDNYYFSPSLALPTGGVAKGLKRTVGGNLDRYNQTNQWDWDIWMNGWQKLPALQ